MNNTKHALATTPSPSCQQVIDHCNQNTSMPEVKGISQKVVEAMIARQGRFSMEVDDVAEDLELSVEELRYQLKQEGEAFRQLRTQVRHSLAVLHLIEGTSIDDIACRLGFSARNTFTDAFKRWTGLPPNQFRKYYAS